LNLCWSTNTGSACSAWPLCLVYREVGIISGVVPVKNHKAFTQGKQRDGARRIQVALAENGDHADLKTILNSVKRQGLKAKAGRKFKVTTDSNHQLPVAPNLLHYSKIGVFQGSYPSN